MRHENPSSIHLDLISLIFVFLNSTAQINPPTPNPYSVLTFGVVGTILPYCSVMVDT